MSELKAYILDRFALRNCNYRSWLEDCPVPSQIVEESAPAWQPPDDTGIVITHMHYRWEEISALRRILDKGNVPILILSDGVIEFRNTWNNPTIADGAIFQPLMGHKLACIGRGQARVVESWGNVGKCEVVGLPRFDRLIDREFLPVNTEGPLRLLIATANSPAFTEPQRATVIRSLIDLRERLERNPWVNRRRIQVHWRLTGGLDKELDITSFNDESFDALPLDEIIESVDAVITTPSTLYFESTLKRRPTAILDYGNNPQYFGAAWTISAPAHIATVLNELSDPSPAKMQFQRAVLHDQLECTSPAKTRLLTLIKAMVDAGAEARRNGELFQLPTRILSDPQRGIQVVESEFDHSVLYPDGHIFQNQDVTRLQAELCQAIHRLGQLPEDLDRKNRHIDDMEVHLEQSEQRIAEYREKVDQLLGYIKQKDEYITRKNAHIEVMQKHLKTALNRVQELLAQLGKKNAAAPSSKTPTPKLANRGKDHDERNGSPEEGSRM